MIASFQSFWSLHLNLLCLGAVLNGLEALKVILSVYCVGESHNPTPQHVALT